MKAKALLDSGQLTEALVEVKREVKAHPSDSQLRTFLFELLCLAGDLDGAERQLEVIAHQDTTTALAIEIYKNVIQAERNRRQVFAEAQEPESLFEKPTYLQNHLEGLRCLKAQQYEQANSQFELSETGRLPVTGKLDGQTFSEILDGDDRLGPFLEIIVHSSYVWLPFEHIKNVSIKPPKHLRDLVWIPAEIDGQAGPIGPVFLPVLYVGSWQSENDQVRLGRMTQWDSPGANLALGVGQRLFLVDGEDRGILEIKNIDFDGNGEHQSP